MLKRQKLADPAPQKSSRKNASKVFSPFRTIGLVSNQVPFAVSTLGQSYIITTVVGRSFQVYDASNLSLLFLSQPQTDAPIDCVHANFHHIFAAWGNKVGIYRRGRLEFEFQLADPEKIKKITTFGDFLCVLTDSKLSVFTWDAKTKAKANAELYTTIDVPALEGKFVDMAHPATYLNKLLVATSNSVLLFNVKTSKLVYSFPEIESGIAFIKVSPATLDTVAVVSQQGDIHLLNMRKSKTFFTLKLGEPVTSLTFRSDGRPMLGVGTPNGDAFFYDLESRRRVHSVRTLHGGGITNLEFLAGQAIVVSAGADNKLIEMVFDPPLSESTTAISTPPRILRQRGGLAQPPTTLAFADEESHFLLAASLDQSLWSFSLRKDSQNRELSQKSKSTKSKMFKMSLDSKLPPISDLSYQAARQNEWDSILTCHRGERYARTWNGKRGILGDHELNTVDGGLARSVFISYCGNFGFVGSSLGGIAGYNMQSGIVRKKLPQAHKLEVTGVVADQTNSVLVSSSLDGTLAFHDFRDLKLIATLNLKSGINSIRFHPGAGLIAAALDDESIRVVDLSTRKVVREFWGHGNRITALDFTPDGRFVISGSLDDTIRTWDIPSGGCIDAVKVPQAVTMLRVSPANDYLATSHINGNGIQLWNMKSQFMRVSTTTTVQDDDITEILMPNAAGEGGSGVLDAAISNDADADDDIEVEFDIETPIKLSSDLETLSLKPRYIFNSLVHIDAIRQRNKAKEPLKVPEKLPFFLTAGSANSQIGQNGQTGQDGQKNGHSEMNTSDPDGLVPSGVAGESQFTRLLRLGQLQELVDYLASLGPAATDLEIRSISTQEPHSELIAFIAAMADQIEKRQNFDLVQAWFNMLLRVHGDLFVHASDRLKQELSNWQAVQNSEASRVKSLLQYCLGVISYLRRI